MNLILVQRNFVQVKNKRTLKHSITTVEMVDWDEGILEDISQTIESVIHVEHTEHTAVQSASEQPAPESSFEEESNFLPATESEIEEPVQPKQTDGGAICTISSSTSQSWSHPNRQNIRYTVCKGESRSRSSTPVHGPGCGKAGVKRLSSTLAMTTEELDEDYQPPPSTSSKPSNPGKNALCAMALAVTKASSKGKIVLTKVAHAKLEAKWQSKEELVRDSESGKSKVITSTQSIHDQQSKVQGSTVAKQ